MPDTETEWIEKIEKQSVHVLKSSAFYPGLVLIQLLIVIVGEATWGISWQVSMTYTAMPVIMAWALKYKIDELELITFKKDPITDQVPQLGGQRSFAVQGIYYLVGFTLTWTVVFVLVYLGHVEVGQVMIGTTAGLFMMNVFLVGPTETMVFHAMIPDRIEKYFTGYNYQRIYKYGISQFLFAGFHFAAFQGDISLMLTSFVFGCIFLWVSENYGLATCMGVHAAYNICILGILTGGIIGG